MTLHQRVLSDPAEAASIPELLSLARLRMSQEAFDYVELGAGGETTAQRNRQAFDCWDFRPRFLTGASAPDTTSGIGTLATSLPVITSPFGNDTFIHPDGHLAVARAVHRMGTVTVVPHGGGHSMERVAEAADGSLGMFQVGLTGSDDEVLATIDRAAACGYPFILFTHLPVAAWRERVREHRLDLSPHGQANRMHPGPERDSDEARAPSIWDWHRFERVVSRSSLPWFLKGVQEPADARRALNCGAFGVYVSNYGGRNLDGVPAAITRLAAVSDEVAGRVPIVFDSGIRRGSDVVKALALGATVVAVGRLTAFALGAGGEPAVHRLLELLQGEIVAVMAELGVSRPSDLDRSHLQPQEHFSYPELLQRNAETLPGNAEA